MLKVQSRTTCEFRLWNSKLAGSSSNSDDARSTKSKKYSPLQSWWRVQRSTRNKKKTLAKFHLGTANRACDAPTNLLLSQTSTKHDAKLHGQQHWSTENYPPQPYTGLNNKSESGRTKTQWWQLNNKSEPAEKIHLLLDKMTSLLDYCHCNNSGAGSTIDKLYHTCDKMQLEGKHTNVPTIASHHSHQ